MSNNQSGAHNVRLADWSLDRDKIHAIRSEVFVREQNVPSDVEWDGLDSACLHVLVEDENRDAIGTGRLHSSGKIGRMAVVQQWRSRGVGRAILDHLLAVASQNGHEEVYLHAQTRAAGFYKGAGFRFVGEIFEEAGIPHRLMRKTLDID